MVSEIYRAQGPVRAALNAPALLQNIHVGSGESEMWSEELRYEFLHGTHPKLDAMSCDHAMTALCEIFEWTHSLPM